MFAFLFGWLFGSSYRATRIAALPESVTEARYEAAPARRAKAKQTWARRIGFFALFVIAYWIVREIVRWIALIW